MSADTDTQYDLYERSGGQTTLISTGPAGGNGAFEPSFEAVSADGARVLFRTDESLISADTDTAADVYVKRILPPPGNTAPPAISGVAQVGRTLGCSQGSWTNAPTSFAYAVEARRDGDRGRHLVSLQRHRRRRRAPDHLHRDRLQRRRQRFGHERARDPGSRRWSCSAPGPLPGACANVQTGGVAADRLTGSAFGDRLRGLAGNDVLIALAGDDCLSGGADNDRLTAGAGKDRLSGGAGKDKLRGGPGKDKLTGGKGKDKLKGGPGDDSDQGPRRSPRDRQLRQRQEGSRDRRPHRQGGPLREGQTGLDVAARERRAALGSRWRARTHRRSCRARRAGAWPYGHASGKEGSPIRPRQTALAKPLEQV